MKADREYWLGGYGSNQRFARRKSDDHTSNRWQQHQ